jgi:hypothetical protein
MLREFTFRNTSSLLLDMFAPAGKFFYRPLAWLYCWVVYTLFGLHPVGFHLLAILLLAFSSFLVVSVAWKLTGDQRVAWGSGFLYAAASNIHIDPQMWLVGVFDIGGGLFGLLCVDSFVKKRFAISAVWFTLALGFKESTAMLLFVLAVWTLLSGSDPSDEKPAILRVFNRLRWHGLAFLALAAAKSPGVSLFTLPQTHPYAARLIGNHIGTDFQLYAIWGLQAVAPLKRITFSENGALTTLFIVTAALVLVLITGVRHFTGRARHVHILHTGLVPSDALSFTGAEAPDQQILPHGRPPPPCYRHNAPVQNHAPQCREKREIHTLRHMGSRRCKCDRRGGISIPACRARDTGRDTCVGKGRGQ